MADKSMEIDVEGIVKRIAAIKKNTEELKAMSSGILAVDRNADRILASVKMLEINISDVAGLLIDD